MQRRSCTVRPWFKESEVQRRSYTVGPWLEETEAGFYSSQRCTSASAAALLQDTRWHGVGESRRGLSVTELASAGVQLGIIQWRVFCESTRALRRFTDHYLPLTAHRSLLTTHYLLPSGEEGPLVWARTYDMAGEVCTRTGYDRRQNSRAASWDGANPSRCRVRSTS